MITMLMVASMTVMMLTRVMMMMITLRILNMTIMMTSLLAMTTTLLGKETVTWVRGCKCTAEFEAWAFWVLGFQDLDTSWSQGFCFRFDCSEK